MFQEVVHRLTGKAFASADATLRDFARYAWLREYAPPVPAIRPEPGRSVAGKLLKDVDAGSMAIFDDFEGVAEGYYRRISVAVRLDSGERTEAFAYAAGPRIRGLLHGEWSPETFRSQWLADYIDAPD